MTRLIALISRLLMIIAAQRILIENINGWGVKKSYHATTDELLILIKAGAEKIKINEDLGDGTYLHQVIFMGFKFTQSTLEILKIE